MNIEDKDINKLLQDFEGEDIKVPKNLDDKLNNKLKELKPKKYKKILLSTIASILIFILSYSIIPSFKTFANQVFKYIFGDVGVENAANNGYENIEGKNVNIAGFDIDITNIYMDRLRISFDATINNISKDEFEKNSYSIFVKNEDLGSVAVDNGFFREDEKKITSNILVIGEGVGQLFEDKKEKLELELELTKEKRESGDRYEGFNREVIGTTNVVFDIPKEVYYRKVIEINKNINDNNLNLNIKNLDTSPTMMYLDTNGKFNDDSKYSGLYNFKIVSEKGNVYKESLALSATGGEDDYRQTIVPSIYYDKSKSFRLKADGVIINPYETVKLKLNDTYPKEIDYYNGKLTINNVYYENKELVIEIIGNKNIEYMGSCSIDGEYSNGGGMTYTEDEEDLYFIRFDIDKRDSYDVLLEVMMKYKLPIDIKIDYNK